MSQMPIRIVWRGSRPLGHVPPRTRFDIKLTLNLFPRIDPPVPSPPYLEPNQVINIVLVRNVIQCLLVRMVIQCLLTRFKEEAYSTLLGTNLS